MIAWGKKRGWGREWIDCVELEEGVEDGVD